MDLPYDFDESDVKVVHFLIGGLMPTAKKRVNERNALSTAFSMDTVWRMKSIATRQVFTLSS